MSPRYDFYCSECDTLEEKDVPLKFYKDPQWCMFCGSELTRVIPAPLFKIKGFSEANGYSNSKGGNDGN